MTQQAHIAGSVHYRAGDGANIAIRRGPCDIDLTASDATISWTDGNTHGSAAMPMSDFKRHVAVGAIRMVERRAGSD